MTEQEQNLTLSRDPIELDIHRLANEAHTHAFLDYFAAVLTANRMIFPSQCVITMKTQHPFAHDSLPAETEQVGKKEFVTTAFVADIFADLRATGLFLYESDNDTVDWFWDEHGAQHHLWMTFDNPIFRMKD